MGRHLFRSAVRPAIALTRDRTTTKLVGEETAWRIRVGDYRVIYDVLDEALVVTVVRAAHRREAYDR